MSGKNHSDHKLQMTLRPNNLNMKKTYPPHCPYHPHGIMLHPEGAIVPQQPSRDGG